MKLAAVFFMLAAAAATTTTSASDAVKVMEGFLSEQQVDEILTAADLDIFHAATKTLGVADVSSDILARMDEVLGISDRSIIYYQQENNEQDQDAPVATVPIVTSVIHTTTAIHQDHHWNDDGSSGAMVQQPVAFIFLNSNDKAMFVHGGQDDEEQEQVVPVIKGNLVTFPGNVKHNTVVMEGVVQLLGPFDVEDWGIVGPSPTVPSPTAPSPTAPSPTAAGGDCLRNRDCGRGLECDCPSSDDKDEAADFFGDEDNIFDNERRFLLLDGGDHDYGELEEKQLLMSRLKNRRLAIAGGKKGKCRVGGTCVEKKKGGKKRV
jgi:hypothetical protein